MNMDTFLAEMRLFRQKLFEELGDMNPADVLAHYMAFKRIQRSTQRPFDYISMFSDLINTTGKADPDDEGNNDDPFNSGNIPFR